MSILTLLGRLDQKDAEARGEPWPPAPKITDPVLHKHLMAIAKVYAERPANIVPPDRETEMKPQ